MAYPQLQNDDPTILGDAQTYLQATGVKIVTANPSGVPYDRMRPVQNWIIEGATDDLVAPSLAIDPKTHTLDFDNPHLKTKFFPVAWLLTPNIPDNPTAEKTATTLMPPLHDLGPDEHLVTLTSGAFLFPQIYVRRGSAPPPPPSTGGPTDGFTQKEREFILTSLTTLLNR